jgi:hypothetical protein
MPAVATATDACRLWHTTRDLPSFPRVHVKVPHVTCRRCGVIAAGWLGGGGVVVSARGGAMGVFGDSSSFASCVLDAGVCRSRRERTPHRCVCHVTTMQALGCTHSGRARVSAGWRRCASVWCSQPSPRCRSVWPSCSTAASRALFPRYLQRRRPTFLYPPRLLTSSCTIRCARACKPPPTGTRTHCTVIYCMLCVSSEELDVVVVAAATCPLRSGFRLPSQWCWSFPTS